MAPLMARNFCERERSPSAKTPNRNPFNPETQWTNCRRNTIKNPTSNHSPLRRINGFISLGLVVLFLIHESLGAITGVTVIPDSLKWLVWVGVGGIMAHIGLSGATTVEMMDDQERSPSQRKRRHQVKKWVTGGVVAALALVHLAIQSSGISPEVNLGGSIPDGTLTGALSIFSMVISLLLAIALAYHICVGVKSLTTDIGASAGLRLPLRIIVIVIAAMACFLLLVSVW